MKKLYIVFSKKNNELRIADVKNQTSREGRVLTDEGKADTEIWRCIWITKVPSKN